MRVSQLAINSVSTRHSSLEEALDAYADAGFRNVEFVLPQVREWMAQDRTADDARMLLDERGLQCIGGFHTGVECFSAPQSVQENHSLTLRNAELIRDLGGSVLVVGTDGPARPSTDALDHVARTLRDLAPRLAEHGVTLCVEFNWSPLIRSLKSAVLLAEKADHPNVGVLFDPAHYYVTPTKTEDIDARAVRWIKHVHMDDMRDKPADLSHCNDDRVLPGEGILNLAEIVDALERHGYEGFYSIEMFNADLWQLPAAEAALRCYKSLLPLCNRPD